MDNTAQNNGLADAQRRLHELREAEARQAQEKAVGERDQKERDRQDEQVRASVATSQTSQAKQASEPAGETDDRNANLQADQRKEDDRRADDRLQDDRRQEDDRKADNRKKEDREKERLEAQENKEPELSSVQLVQRVNLVRGQDQSEDKYEDNSLQAQMERHRAGQADEKGEGTDTSEESGKRIARPAEIGGKHVLEPRDLENQEREANTPRPQAERRFTDVSTTDAAGMQAEREHFANGRRNEALSTNLMAASLAKNNAAGATQQQAPTTTATPPASANAGKEQGNQQARQGTEKNDVASRVEARNQQRVQESVSAGKTEPSEATRSFAAEANSKLDQAESQMQEKNEKQAGKSVDSSREKELTR